MTWKNRRATQSRPGRRRLAGPVGQAARVGGAVEQLGVEVGDPGRVGAAADADVVLVGGVEGSGHLGDRAPPRPELADPVGRAARVAGPAEGVLVEVVDDGGQPLVRRRQPGEEGRAGQAGVEGQGVRFDPAHRRGCAQEVGAGCSGERGGGRSVSGRRPAVVGQPGRDPAHHRRLEVSRPRPDGVRDVRGVLAGHVTVARSGLVGVVDAEAHVRRPVVPGRRDRRPQRFVHAVDRAHRGGRAVGSGHGIGSVRHWPGSPIDQTCRRGTVSFPSATRWCGWLAALPTSGWSRCWTVVSASSVRARRPCPGRRAARPGS